MRAEKMIKIDASERGMRELIRKRQDAWTERTFYGRHRALLPMIRRSLALHYTNPKRN